MISAVVIVGAVLLVGLLVAMLGITVLEALQR